MGGAKVSMRSVSVHVWVDAPLTTRVTLNMMDFDGREVGRSAKSFEVPHVSSTHRLSAKGSRDASLRVESTRAWRFCGCVRGRATPGPCNARDNAFGWASGWWRAPESCARCLAGAAVASTFCVQRNPTMPLWACWKHACGAFLWVWTWTCHSKPVQCSRWCIWMGEWSGAPESYARYLRCCCKHLLCAKGSHDASVRVQARV